MKTQYISSLSVALVAAALSCGMTARANNVQMLQTPGGVVLERVELHPAAFSDTAEAKLLRNAYIILAHGDHDYNGHRAGAMQQVKAAADLLGLDISGDANNKEVQPLSDDKMREAKTLIVQVLDSAAVKDQKRVVKHLNEAVHQINQALGIK